MSLLTQKQLQEIQNFHDDIGECTEPHEECFIKKLIKWNEKQSAMPNQEVSPVGYLYKQKDCYGGIQTVFSFDKPYITWHTVTDVIPVYTAPPKREPPITSREMYQRGYAAAERDLNRKPLSIDWAEAPENTAIAKVALFWVTEDNLMLGRKDLASIEKPVNGADGD